VYNISTANVTKTKAIIQGDWIVNSHSLLYCTFTHLLSWYSARMMKKSSIMVQKETDGKQRVQKKACCVKQNNDSTFKL